MYKREYVVKDRFFEVEHCIIEKEKLSYELLSFNTYFLANDQLSSTTMFFSIDDEETRASFKQEDNNISIISIGKGYSFFTLSIPKEMADTLKDYITTNTKWGTVFLDDVEIPEDAGIEETKVEEDLETKDVEVVEDQHQTEVVENVENKENNVDNNTN